MTMDSVPAPYSRGVDSRGADSRTVDEIFANVPPVRSADDLAHDGIFGDDELTDFLADLDVQRYPAGR